MPSGKIHTKSTITLSILLLFLVRPFSNAMLVSLGCMIGTIISPDLDVDTGHYGFSIIRKRFGRIPATLWGWFWRPYSKIVPHRHWMSHFPIISTFFRFSYLFAPIFLIFGDFMADYVKISLFMPVFIGLVLADTLHFLMDISSSYFKRILRKF